MAYVLRARETIESSKRTSGYQAANWIRLGLTTGRGRMDRHTRYLSTPKVIYVYPLVRDFRCPLHPEQPGSVKSTTEIDVQS